LKTYKDYDEFTHEITVNNGTFRVLDITALEYKLSKISKKINKWNKSQLNLIKQRYNNNPTSTINLDDYNRAQNGLLDIQSYYDTCASMYDAVYSRLEAWATNLNIDTSNSALAKTSYTMSSLILEKLEQKVSSVKNGISIPEMPSLDNLNIESSNSVENRKVNNTKNEQSILAEETLSEPQLSYTEFVWEGTLNDDGTSDTN